MEPERRKIKETSSLSQSRKGPKTCYGATRAPQSAPDYKLVPHTLEPSDTLQGIAIKYGVTVSEHLNHYGLIEVSIRSQIIQ